jgi:GNAT superfamily N-acetyltransferase
VRGTDLPARQAQRLEAIEASVSEACVEAMLAAHPASGATVQPIGGGSAFFFGPLSPLSQAVGVGMHGPVSEEEFDRLEQFFLARQSPVALSLCPYADPSVLACLASRRYRITQFEHTMVRQLDADPGQTPAPPVSAPHLLIRPAAAGEAALWAGTVMEGFNEGTAGPEGLADLFAVMSAAPRATSYLAWRDGQPAGGGAVSIRPGESAMLYSDATLPAFRRQGIQSALIAARLQEAFHAGCPLAMACAGPGTASQRNYERFGFRIAYTKAILTSP